MANSNHLYKDYLFLGHFVSTYDICYATKVV